MTTIQIRIASPSDSRALWLWRNDAHARSMFKSTEKVSWEAHNRWVEATLADPASLLFIGFDEDETRIGVCRFDLDSATGTAAVSINLNPSMRGKRLSQRFLAAGIETFRNRYAHPLIATIRHHNTASKKCFMGCGFVHERDDDEYSFYRRDA